MEKLLLAGCEDYKLLTNPNRKKTYSTPSGQWKSDKSGCNYTASDWQGPGWYRISPSIRTKIPTSPTKWEHCGNWYSGWISGGSTPGLGQTINAKACFVLNDGNNCKWSSNVEIRNCRDFILTWYPILLSWLLCWITNFQPIQKFWKVISNFHFSKHFVLYHDYIIVWPNKSYFVSCI